MVWTNQSEDGQSMEKSKKKFNPDIFINFNR